MKTEMAGALGEIALATERSLGADVSGGLGSGNVAKRGWIVGLRGTDR